MSAGTLDFVPSLVLHAAAWTDVDGAETRRAGGGARERRGDAERRRARRPGRLLLDGLRVRRAQERAVRRVGRAGAALGVRPHEARRGARGPRGLDRPQLVALRLDGPQLRADDARASAPSRTRSRWSTTSAARRRTSATSPPRSETCSSFRTAPTTSPPQGDCTWAEFAEAIFEEAGLDLPRAADHDRGARPPGPAPGQLGPAQRARRSGAAPLARGPAPVPGPSLKDSLVSDAGHVPPRRVHFEQNRWLPPDSQLSAWTCPASDTGQAPGARAVSFSPGGFFDLEPLSRAAPTRLGWRRTTRRSRGGRPRSRSPARQPSSRPIFDESSR